MVNKSKQTKKGLISSSSVVNGLSHTNGCPQKNGTRDSEDEQNSNVAFPPSGAVNSSTNLSQDDSPDIRTSHEPTASCSAESQTDISNISSACSKAPEDGLINFIKLSPWSRVETICEIVKVLSPQELRLVGACLEGAARPSATLFKRQENSANSGLHIGQCLGSGRWSYPVAVKETFDMICLLSSTNRQTAFSYVKLIDQLMADRHRQLRLLPEDVRLDTLQNLGKLVTAALHHPAFSVDQCMRLETARDELLQQFEKFRPSSETSVSDAISSPSSLTYIKRIVAYPPKEPTGSDSQFSIELQWNDGQTTWVNRSRKEIASLHHRLLDAFGDERRDETPNTSTVSSPAPQEQAASSRGPARILPYFKQSDMSDAQIVEYLNGLSDLPARMMLSSVIYEEFYVSRQRSVEESADDRYAQSSSLSNPLRMPLTSPQTFVMAMTPLSYGNTNGHLQLNVPTCSNCAGEHSYVQCPIKPFIEVELEGKDGYRINLGSQDVDNLKRHSSSPNFPPGIPLPMAYIGPNGTPMVFDHHIFNNNGAFPVFPVTTTQPQQAPQQQ